jgi:hypothetical protein
VKPLPLIVTMLPGHPPAGVNEAILGPGGCSGTVLPPHEAIHCDSQEKSLTRRLLSMLSMVVAFNSFDRHQKLSLPTLFLKTPNAAHHAPPQASAVNDSLRVGGRVHALVLR